ncbi:DUF5683 domain-containing protein [Hymenobacter tibetensis]|uniref:DUF5683 domain-containing protein n=1 Tax=Hymenobacter tibetensis TaxID=497967 RepID=A0ABY4CU57_9BACT|nr:DUF5683 domain-containing protein [Hymenobacter tibetensis]UOG73789.1 DUF5683 domain-containing protein [Hymenobacter tibetensis]
MNPRSSFLNAAAAVLLTVPLAHQATAQVSPPTQTTTVTAGPDSVQVSTPVVPDSVRRTARLFGLKMTKPSKAGLLSALLPSAGQIYNRRWWKLPLVYGAVGGTLYGELFYLRYYRAYVKADDIRSDGDPLTVDEGELTKDRRDSEIARGIEFYRRQRDVFIAYVGVAYAIQILDAVVDAHLRDFDISDDLSLQLDPTVMRMPTVAAAPGIGITLTFK